MNLNMKRGLKSQKNMFKEVDIIEEASPRASFYVAHSIAKQTIY